MEGTDPPGAILRVLVWLGLEQDQSEWARAAPGGEVAVFAETYENNVNWDVTNITPSNDNRLNNKFVLTPGEL